MISEEYKKQLNQLQKRKKFTQKNFWYDEVKKFLSEHQPESVIDFGCANGVLVDQIKQDFKYISRVDGYDPGVIEYEKFPDQKYDILISTDVFEHIEPEYLDSTLEAIDNLFLNFAWIIIACYPAKKFLPDGRNAHLTVEPPEWWMEKIKSIMTHSSIVHENIIRENKRGLKELRLILRKNGKP
jgi:hypothetical protein